MLQGKEDSANICIAHAYDEYIKYGYKNYALDVVERIHDLAVKGRIMSGSEWTDLEGSLEKNQAEADNLQVDNIKSMKVLFKSDGTYDANGSPVVDITTKRNGDGLAVNASSRTEQAKHL